MKNNNYINFYQNLNKGEKNKVDIFFRDINKRVSISKKLKKSIIEDYQNALLYYDQKISIHDALRRLDSKDLGTFYKNEEAGWYPLDNAAKIYPLSLNLRWMASFRLSVYLKKDIVPELLQIALTTTIKRFPYFATTISQGFFWHYLDGIKKKFTIEKENSYLCEPINLSLSNAHSFRVMYWQNRISVEFFHVLTDGTGGLIFVKTLVAQYLKLLGKTYDYDETIKNINEVAKPSESSNDFTKALYSNKKSTSFFDKKAAKMNVKLTKIRPSQIISFDLNAQELKEVAHKYHVTVTVLILGYIFIANATKTFDKKRYIQIQVPVNMRNFYPSTTLRNFSLFCSIKIKKEETYNFEELLLNIKKQLDEQADKDQINLKMITTNKLVKQLKYVPLFIKKFAFRFIYYFAGDKVFSNTISNLGVVNFPKQLANEIVKMDFLLGPANSVPIGCALITTNNVATLSITKITNDESFEKSIANSLKKDSINYLTHGSIKYETR